MMTGNGVMHNGTTVLDEYGHNLDRLKVGPAGGTPGGWHCEWWRPLGWGHFGK